MITNFKNSKSKAVLDKLEKEGHLINVYSERWVNLKNEYEFTIEDHNWLIERYGKQFDSHLLVVYLVEQNYETCQNLVNFYPILKKSLNENIYQPTFLFINLETNQILCAGLGRRSSLFLIDAESHNPLIEGDTYYDTYIRKFTALDHQNVVLDIIDALEHLGKSYLELDQIPGSLEQLEQLLISANQGISSFSFKNDSQIYTLEQLQEFQFEYKEIFENQAEWIEIIQKYFPQFKSHHQKMLTLLTE